MQEYSVVRSSVVTDILPYKTIIVEDEINGLLTYDRKVEKVGKEKMLEINVAVQDKFHQVLSSREKSKNS